VPNSAYLEVVLKSYIDLC